ncbi:hypothetical protein NOF55_22975 [Rhizobiaceae bacterium BDR2-2]|uniref:Transmembrane protein n=1 Tax=Ectorhizobium quercum TaxID=2965071 RepID=A0AAE3N4Y4_9HYPH|nr:hypothetical protein [Ectorhizobium quercum]MCX8999972.1 hypothetical protein [Ectorhizobium quercum]
MGNEDSWKDVRLRHRASRSSYRTGALNLALLFGTAIVALTLILTPILASKHDSRSLALIADDFDLLTTGSVPPRPHGKSYSIRRSVLQETPGSVCIVEGYGNGAC